MSKKFLLDTYLEYMLKISEKYLNVYYRVLKDTLENLNQNLEDI